jgi:RHS repeat-associated protein
MGGRSGLYGTVDGVTEKFTGKERDAELAGSGMQGLDYFGARYFSSAQGRWTSPDWSATPQPIPYADLRDPQTLNLYAYVRNNPLSRADLDGHADCGGEKNKSWLFCLGNALGLNQTEAQKVEEARTYFEYNPTHDAQGNLIDPTMLSNADVLKAFGTVNQQVRDQVLANAIATAGDRAVSVYVNLTDLQAQQHILDGDPNGGGGHRPGTGIPGKSEFPVGWSDQQILHDISDVATDPNSKVTVQGRTKLIEGRRDGVDIRVVERDGRIVTAYPTNLPRNPKP